jgi:hypothetical protein
LAYIVGRSGQVPQPNANAARAKKAKKARTVAIELPADISLKVSVADLSRIGASPGLSAATKAAAPPRTAKPPARKGRPRVARKSKKKGAKSWACWKCAGPMKKQGTFCKRCKKRQPQAVKSQTAMLTKSLGRAPKPVPVPVAKAATVRCPNPACGAGASLDANCCTRCGTPLGMAGQIRADKAAKAMQLQIVHSAAWWEAEAARQHDPEAREQCRAEARKAAGAQGRSASAASLIVRASGSRTVREAWLRESDPHMREVLRQALYNGGGRSA